MEDLYWLTRLTPLNTFFFVCSIITWLLGVFCLILYFDGFRPNKAFKRFTFSLCPIAMLLTIATILLPTTKEALFIYGVGGAIDYVKSNETAKKLPDKVIIALDKYLDDINNKNKKEKEDED